MNTMSFYVWLFLAFFTMHEFEEIFMVEAWWTGNKEKIKTLWPKVMPFGLNYAGPYLTASIAIAIFCQFLLLFAVCLLCGIFNNFYVWYGFVIQMVMNSVLLHFRDVIKYKGYTPGFVTSAILFIPMVWLLYQTNTLLHYGIWEIILSVVLAGFVGWLFLSKLHKSVITWSKWLCKFSKTEISEEIPGEAASQQ